MTLVDGDRIRTPQAVKLSIVSILGAVRARGLRFRAPCFFFEGVCLRLHGASAYVGLKYDGSAKRP